MTLRDDLIAAKALIADPTKWCKGIKRGRCCAMFALAGEAPGHRYNDGDRALMAAVPRSFAHDGLGHKIVAFNDHPDTTHADIMALFDRAIARAS